MKYIRNLIGIAVVLLLALGIVNFHKIKEKGFFKSKADVWRESICRKVALFKHNLSFSVNPERKAPLSFAGREGKLIHLAEKVFGQFDSSQWKEFWDLIFEPIEEERDGSKAKRYRTKEEIESYLKYNYSNPFSYFREQHWEYFWGVVFEG
jgi:hypothetical protein